MPVHTQRSPISSRVKNGRHVDFPIWKKQQRPGGKQTRGQARSQDTWARVLASLCMQKMPPPAPAPPPPLDLTAFPHSEVASTPSLCLFSTGEDARVIAAQRSTATLPLWGFPLSKNGILCLSWPPRSGRWLLSTQTCLVPGPVTSS